MAAAIFYFQFKSINHFVIFEQVTTFITSNFHVSHESKIENK